MSIITLRLRRPGQVRRRNPAGFRPAIDGLEARTVMSGPGTMAPPVHVQSIGFPSPHQLTQSMVPISVTGVAVSNNQLVADVQIGSHTIAVPVTLSVTSGASASASPNAAATTPILELHLAPIDLNLLGLEVKTSNICLDITAQSGPGNLLGNLLTDVANLLNGGTSLGNILGGLSPSQLTTLTNGITGLLNGVLGALSSPTSVSASGTTAGTPATAASPTSTPVLHLSLGPVNLNLLGLDVHLDNCNNGPVTLDITANNGPGNLLGNLISDVAHLLDSNASITALTVALNKTAGTITSLLG
ncbi:MAG TPA: hypothetical protein VG406_04765 [Isosphaeraceae bacterium]|jgi:hypothetical protein|nr:hypothetical protein [Isosphaeraceae bacterium]